MARQTHLQKKVVGVTLRGDRIRQLIGLSRLEVALAAYAVVHPIDDTPRSGLDY
jgi:hypothetical protein